MKDYSMTDAIRELRKAHLTEALEVSSNTLADFYHAVDNDEELKDTLEAAMSFDYPDDDKAEELLSKWVAVKELDRISSQANFEKLKNDPDALLILHGNDIGDGHGDAMMYFFNYKGKVYCDWISSNEEVLEPMRSYKAFKNNIYFQDFWQKVSFGKLRNNPDIPTDDYYAPAILRAEKEAGSPEDVAEYLRDLREESSDSAGYFMFQEMFDSDLIKKFLFK